VLSTSMLAVIALAPPAAAATGAPAITREQALSLPPRELGRIVLGQIGDRVEDVSRPVLQGIPFPDDRLKFMQFGLTPRGLGPGLCQATIVHVSFSSDAAAAADGRTVPVRAATIATSVGYKITGEQEGNGSWQPADWERQAALCLRARPIVPAETANLSLPGYFGYDGRLAVDTAARVLRRALAEAEAGTLADLRCLEMRGYPYPCNDPRIALHEVSLDHLAQAHSEEIAPLRYRITASFRDPAHVGLQTMLEISVEAEFVDPFYPAQRIARVGAMTVRRATYIFD
jgi:hypothetical protein